MEGERHEFEPELMHRKIEKVIAAGYGKETALIFKESLEAAAKRVSYDDMNNGANRIARYLLKQTKDRKTKSNTDNDWIIAICMNSTDEVIVLALAALKTGAAYMPLDPTWPANRIQHIMNESRPVLLVYDERNPSWPDEIFSNTTLISWEECRNASSSFPSENLNTNEMFVADNDQNVAIIGYTSGSTGMPKGVRIQHSICMNHLNWQLRVLPFHSDERTGVFKTALMFLDCMREIFGPLFSGRQVLIVPKDITKDTEKFVAILEEYKIKRMLTVPTMLRTILTFLKMQKGRKHLQDLTLMMTGSETLPPQLAVEYYEYFDEKKHVLINMYGATELSADVTYYIIEGKAHARRLDKIPLGYPIFNTAIYAMDKKMRPLPSGKQGQIYVSGKALALGYVNGREPERFCANPCSDDPLYDRLYCPGDYGHIDKSGLIHYEGRTDTQVKVRGHRINLREIDGQMLTIPGILQAITLAFHSGKDDQSIISFILVDDGKKTQLNEDTVKNLLKSKLTDYMIPDHIITIESVPLTISGKTDRQSLLAIFQNEKARNIGNYYDYSGVRKADLPKAKALFETIATVTKFAAKSISIRSNFYEIGGNSLNSILTVAMLKEKGYTVNLGNFIAARSLQEIVSKMTDGADDGKSPSVADKMDIRRVMLGPEDKAQAILVICRSFYDKSELDSHLTNVSISLEDYINTLKPIWDDLVSNDLCFAVKDKNGRVLGVSLNYDTKYEPVFPLEGGLGYALKTADYLEGPVKAAFPKDKLLLLTFMMGTHWDLSPSENVATMAYMEEEVQKLAREKGYHGILTTNISQLTQQLMAYEGYKVLNQIQINQFDCDGVKPYSNAPDSYVVTVEYKEL